MFLLIQATRKHRFLLQRSQKNPKAAVAADAEGLDHIAKKRSIIGSIKHVHSV